MNRFDFAYYFAVIVSALVIIVTHFTDRRDNK